MHAPPTRMIRAELNVIRDELRCYICHMTLQDPHCLGCNHNFCKACIDVHLRKAVSECPKCGIPTCPSDVHRNQFLDGLLHEWRVVEAALQANEPSDITSSASTATTTLTPLAKRKLPMDVGHTTPTTPSIPTQEDSLSSLLTTQQLDAYRARLAHDDMALLAVPSPSPPRLKRTRLLPPSVGVGVLSIASPSSSQGTSMSVEAATPAPPSARLVLVPQSPPRLSSATSSVFRVLATQETTTKDAAADDDDYGEEIPETEMPVHYDDDDDDEMTQVPTRLHFEATQESDDDSSSPNMLSPSFHVDASQPRPSSPPPSTHVVRVVATNVSKAQRRLLLQCVRSLGGRFGLNFNHGRDPVTGMDMPPVSHVITSCDETKRCPRTQKYMEGLAAQCWIVDIKWALASWKAQRWLPEAEFEIDGDTSARTTAGVPRRCRLGAKGTSDIFHALCVREMHESMEQGTSVAHLVEACGGLWWPSTSPVHQADGRRVVGVVSKTLSVAKCRTLAARHPSTPIVRVAWVLDSISHMEVWDKPSSRVIDVPG
ncbi:Aste57867_16634 [Aphanomyces stellatus]|uniref:RING-type E3 ubiquitin transferase BRCA1 n=1 Tax=Aphanomyces stellatus TaxID=120398 RepID=A0A485L5X5_9STRA|nr:hypothetical protein As57867_016577 [Aphanomyces stellatus]VFT93405.1 Aste57867_16634 [Aphanomyces stellatus]